MKPLKNQKKSKFILLFKQKNRFKDYCSLNIFWLVVKREIDDLDKLSKEVSKNKGKQEDLKGSLDTANQIALLRARQENNWRAYQRDMDQLANERKRLEEAEFQAKKQRQFDAFKILQ